MNGVHFRGRLFCGKENEGRYTWYKRIYINLYNGLQYGLDGCFIQNRTPHRLGLVRTGKIGYSHPHKNQKKRDHEGYDADVSTMFHTHTHSGNVSVCLIHYKRYDHRGNVSALLSTVQ